MSVRLIYCLFLLSSVPIIVQGIQEQPSRTEARSETNPPLAFQPKEKNIIQDLNFKNDHSISPPSSIANYFVHAVAQTVRNLFGRETSLKSKEAFSKNQNKPSVRSSLIANRKSKEAPYKIDSSKNKISGIDLKESRWVASNPSGYLLPKSYATPDCSSNFTI